MLTKFFLGAVAVKIYPHFSIAVVFYAWISFIVKPIQSTADHCMNLRIEKQKSKHRFVLFYQIFHDVMAGYQDRD